MTYRWGIAIAGVGMQIALGAVVVGVASIGNAFGRVFWAWASDSITRRAVLLVMFLIQAVLFWSLPIIHTAPVLTVVTFVILACYRGGLETMPAFVADYFGPKNVGPIYGLMLTAWGCASAFGPLLIATVRQATGFYQRGLVDIAIIMAISVLLPVLVSRPQKFAAARSGFQH